MLVVGENGSGKTNLLEAIHVATQGFSPRTRADGQLVRFGAETARVAVLVDGARRAEIEVAIARGQGKRARLNGETLRAAEQLRSSFPTLVFTPDRLVVVKGAPGARRAYLDRALTRLFPARADLPLSYGEALGQRNACLRKIGIGLSTRDALAPWDAQVAELGAALQEARREALELLSPPFAAAAAALGLPSCELDYSGEPLSEDALAQRLPRDLERGTTGCGPHLDEIVVRAGDRELRSFGSQGEQRTAVLALLLGEARLLAEREAAAGAPLLLLDDVLSELDRGRRQALAAELAGLGQALVTATSENALPTRADQVVYVRPGTAEVV